MAPSGEEHVDASEPWRDRLVLYKMAHPEVVRRSSPKPGSGSMTEPIGSATSVSTLFPKAGLPKIPDRVPELMFRGRQSRQGLARTRLCPQAGRVSSIRRAGNMLIIKLVQQIVTVLSYASRSLRRADLDRRRHLRVRQTPT